MLISCKPYCTIHIVKHGTAKHDITLDRQDIKAVFERNNYRLKDFAEDYGCTVAAVSNFLNGERNAAMEIAASVAAKYMMRVEQKMAEALRHSQRLTA